MRKEVLKKLNPVYVCDILSAVASEPYEVRQISAGSEMTENTAREYINVMVKRGWLKPEVGEGAYRSFTVKYRLSESGRSIIPKLKEVVDFLNPKDGL